MNAAHIAFLLVAGLAAGTVNAIAGGGSLITFPALLATGLPAKAATVTNSVAVFPGYTASVYGSRMDLAELADSRGRRSLMWLFPACVVGSVYGGYFGAALGIMLVAALGLILDESLKRINALKNAISALVGLITVLVFALFGPVDWVDVLLLAPATIVGGYVGARVARRLPPVILRVVIVTLAFVVGIILFVRAFA